eukprot:81467_1
MAATTVAFESGHADMIHDAQLDYYGKYLATASSDKLIKVFEVQGDTHSHLVDLAGHDGPVWQVSWAHPKYGKLLASCSYAKQVFIWKEASDSPNTWLKVYEDREFDASVNSVSWAPHELGLILTVGCADGRVAVYTFKDNHWDKVHFHAHAGGVNSVSWGAAMQPGAALPQEQRDPNQPKPMVKRFVTGGCDNLVKIWSFSDVNGWQEDKNMDRSDGHTDWVRGVAWAPSLGLPTSTVASCSEDKTVRIWTEENGFWKKTATLPFERKVWSVSWSVLGNILAVSQGDNKVSLWKENVDGKWQNLSELDEQAARQNPAE